MDAKLAAICRDRHAALITADAELARTAESSGVRVLNPHALADAVRSPVLPGDRLELDVVRVGRERAQGVGYLADGTMVILEGASEKVGARIEVDVTSIVQSRTGRLLFATPVEGRVTGGSGAMDRVGVVVVAAGSGIRFGAVGPKALVELAGRPLVAHALTGLAAAGLPPAVLVHPPGEAEAFALAAGETPVAASVAGGATRTASVAAGVAALAAEVEVVVVHDAARPLTPPAVIAATLAAVAGQVGVLAAAPAVPVADTLKRTRGREVVETVDRTDLVGVQTPQVFPRAVLDQALASGVAASDDLGLVEELRSRGALTGRIVVTEGSVWSRKVTFPGDLALLELLAAHAVPSTLDATGPT